jgi:hypothetical protein
MPTFQCLTMGSTVSLDAFAGQVFIALPLPIRLAINVHTITPRRGHGAQEKAKASWPLLFLLPSDIEHIDSYNVIRCTTRD